MNYKIITLLIAFILSVSAGFAQTLQLENVIDAPPGTVEVDLDMSGFTSNIGSASINIAIDTELLTYIGGSMPFGGGTILTNTVNGELKLSWFNQAGANANGTFATLIFNYVGALPTDLVFNQVTTEITDVNGSLIDVATFINGSISSATPVGSISLADIEVASVGSNLQMPLTANAIAPALDFEQVTAFQFDISYDPEKLVYAGVTDNTLGIRINGGTLGLIRLSWSDVTPVDLSSNFLLSNFDFKYLGGGVASLNFNSGTVSTETSPNPVAIDLAGGSVRINPAGPTEGVLTIPELYKPTNSVVTVPINVTDILADVSIISLNLSYETDSLTYVGYTANQLSGWVVNVNQSNGTIAAQYTNPTPQTISNGSLLSFDFNYTSSEVALGFAPGTAMQTTVGNFLNLELNDGFVKSSIMINASPNNIDYGSASGGGVFDYNENVTLIATPNAGYSFVNWTEDDNPVSTDANYVFPATTARDLVANFAANDYVLTLTASPENSGTLTGAGTHAFGASVPLTATAAEGYSFVNWTDSEGEVSAVANFNYTMPAAATSLTANFAANDYVLTLTASPENSGTLTGAGTHAFGASVPLTATAAEGYSFVNWTDSEGEVSAVANFNYTMPAAATSLTANFAANDYVLTLTASPENSGTLTGAGTHAFGASVPLTATAAEGYSFVNWTDSEGEVSAVANFNYTMPAAATSLTANFAANDYVLTLTASPENSGTLTGAGTHAFGASVPLTATAAEGYSFVNWTDSEGEVSAAANFNYTMPAAATSLTANFSAINYTLSLVSSPEGAGVLSGSGDYAAGTEVAITATANPGFQFVNWTDGTGEVSAVADFNYTMPLAAATLTANFSPVYSISGKVKYANATGGVRPINTIGSTTTEVILYASDGTTEIDRVVADINGDYIFENVVAGDYVVSAVTNKAWGGVNQTDAFLVFGNPSPTGFDDALINLSADVNNSSLIDQTDAFLIFARINNDISSFVKGDWVFETGSRLVEDGDVTLDIRGVVVGDVNMTWPN